MKTQEMSQKDVKREADVSDRKRARVESGRVVMYWYAALGGQLFVLVAAGALVYPTRY